MAGQIEFLLEIDENGADRRRVDWLTGNLGKRLGDEPGCSAAYLEPAMIEVAVSADIKPIAGLLRAWLERDRYKRMALTDTRTGRRTEVSGMAADKIAKMLESWREPAFDGGQ